MQSVVTVIGWLGGRPPPWSSGASASHCRQLWTFWHPDHSFGPCPLCAKASHSQPCPLGTRPPVERTHCSAHSTKPLPSLKGDGGNRGGQQLADYSLTPGARDGQPPSDRDVGQEVEGSVRGQWNGQESRRSRLWCWAGCARGQEQGRSELGWPRRRRGAERPLV